MDVKDDVIKEGVSGRSILNIKVDTSTHADLLKIENIFPAWHMNKDKWVSISLSDYFPDEYIFSLVDLSYYVINGKKIKSILTSKIKSV